MSVLKIFNSSKVVTWTDTQTDTQTDRLNWKYYLPTYADGNNVEIAVQNLTLTLGTVSGYASQYYATELVGGS